MALTPREPLQAEDLNRKPPLRAFRSSYHTPHPMMRKERVLALVEAFRNVYHDAHCELAYSNPLELLVATLLSAQCTDKRVNIVTEDLFRRYRTARDYAETTQEELEEAVHSTGFYRNKAKNIRAMAAELLVRYNGQVPDTMEALYALPGVGRKTANV